MKNSVLVKIMAAAALPFILIFIILTVEISNFVYFTTLAGKAEAVRLAEHYAAMARSEFEVVYFDMLRNRLQILRDNIPVPDDYELTEQGFSSRVNSMLSGLLRNHFYTSSVWAVFASDDAPDGIIVNALYLEREGFALHDISENVRELFRSGSREWYSRPFGGRALYVTKAELNNYSGFNEGYYSSFMSLPIYNNSGGVIGVVVAELNFVPNFSVEYHRNTGEPNGITQLIVSEDGIIVAAANSELLGESLITLVVENNSFQTVEELSEFMHMNNWGIVKANQYNSIFGGYRSYMAITDINSFYVGSASDYSIFLDIPADMLVSPRENVSPLLFITGIIGLLVILAAVFITAFRGIGREKKLLTDEMNAEFARERKLLINSAKALRGNNRKPFSDAQMFFFGKISREVRTPMNSILGIAQILLSDGRLSDSQKKFINDIQISSESLLRMINDILDLSELSNGKLTLSQHNYNFIRLVDGVNSFARFAAEKKGLGYKHDITGKLPQYLYGDDARLKQILFNITGNAAKFTDTGSVSFNVIINEDTVVFEVKDTGRGIKPELTDGLFNVFGQAGELNTGSPYDANADIGMGLPISKKLTDLMNGKISVAGEYGKGSVFTVTVPKIVGDKNKLQMKTVSSGGSYSKDTRILIVDDNEINLEVAKGLITSFHDIECDVALSGKEALSLIETNKYDLVFMDYMMPEMDGIETTRRLREMGGTRREIPVIALSANATAETKDMLIKAGMNDFLSKPVMIDQMNVVLQKWLPKEKRVQKNESDKDSDNLLGFMEKGGRVITAVIGVSELDLNAGLSNVAFREDVYENSLKLLLNKIPKITETMENCLKEGNISDFTSHMHGMRGSLSALGAATLSALADDLESAGKKNNVNFCIEAFPNFTERLNKLAEQLALIFANAASGEKKSGSRTILDECLNTITVAMESYNYDLMADTVSRVTGLDFGMKINSDTDKIKIFAENFDYDGILHTINELKSELENNPALFEG
ncbi:MAG: response regulator [Oscillospiraceae bacterium]|jgi:signal transduction histidine kinase/CheY-like chemotaxis protein/HPt (histidine-containing phosphotransfer) domain-containing protein|nr:response regulator [Oscillospiraceae bacterium]